MMTKRRRFKRFSTNLIIGVTVLHFKNNNNFINKTGLIDFETQQMLIKNISSLGLLAEGSLNIEIETFVRIDFDLNSLFSSQINHKLKSNFSSYLTFVGIVRRRKQIGIGKREVAIEFVGAHKKSFDILKSFLVKENK